MSVIKATVTISMLFIIVLVSNTAFGQNDPSHYYNNRKWERRGTSSGETVFPKDHIPEDVPPEENSTKNLGKKSAIPLEFLEQLNNVTNISEFIDKFVSKDSIDPKDGLANNFGTENIERGAAATAKAANCIPENAVVPLEPLLPSNDPSISYFPTCTRVKRCSGCCSSPLLACEPIETNLVTFTIIKYQYTGTGKGPLRMKGKEPVIVEQHSKCQCRCRVKEHHCNSYQVYDPLQCRCECKNDDEKQKCLSDKEKIWDWENCKCRCRQTEPCTSTSYFDEYSCKCTQALGTRLNNSTPSILDRKRFIVKAVPVEQDNNTRYDTEV